MADRWQAHRKRHTAFIPNIMSSPRTKKSALANQHEELLTTLQARFEKNGARHPGIEWSKVRAKLEATPERLSSLQKLEDSGGEPDVVAREKDGPVVFVDCSPQSPEGRTSLCYDEEALESRKKFKPKNSAAALAAEWGVELLTEEQYHELQRIGEFDTKSSSWLKTPPEIRELGGAIFGDRRFGRVFIYHNGAESYYAGRGFRARLVV